MIFINQDKKAMKMNLVIVHLKEDKSKSYFESFWIKIFLLYRDLLPEIKRKIAEPQPPANQLVPVSKEIDMDRFKKEAMQFSNDLKSLKTRQSDLEKITKVIFTQNTKLLSENKLLWKELIKNKY